MALGLDAAFSTCGGKVTWPRCVPGPRRQPGRRPCPPCRLPDPAQIAVSTAQGPGVLNFNDGVARPEPAQQRRTRLSRCGRSQESWGKCSAAPTPDFPPSRGTLHPEIMSRGHVPPGARRLCPPVPRPQAPPLLLGRGPGPAWARGARGSHSSSPTRLPAPWRGWIHEGGSACASLGRVVQGPRGHRVSHCLPCCWRGGGSTALALGRFPIFSCELLVETQCLSPRPGRPGAQCQGASQML